MGTPSARFSCTTATAPSISRKACPLPCESSCKTFGFPARSCGFACMKKALIPIPVAIRVSNPNQAASLVSGNPNRNLLPAKNLAAKTKANSTNSPNAKNHLGTIFKNHAETINATLQSHFADCSRRNWAS